MSLSPKQKPVTLTRTITAEAIFYGEGHLDAKLALAWVREHFIGRAEIRYAGEIHLEVAASTVRIIPPERWIYVVNGGLAWRTTEQLDAEGWLIA